MPASRRLPWPKGALLTSAKMDKVRKLEGVRDCGMKPTRLADWYEFRSDKFFPRLIYGSGRLRAFLLCLEPGQGLAPRADSEELVCWLIEGRASLRIGEDVHEVSPGDFAVAAPGEVRGIEAEKRCVAVWVQVSTGSGHDG